MKQVFAIIYDTNKKKSLQELCQDFSVEFNIINPVKINSTIGSLLGFPIPPAGDNPAVPVVYSPPELLIFNGFSGGELESFLNKYSANQIPPIKLKGTVTPHNLNWTVYKLIKEYEEEGRG